VRVAVTGIASDFGTVIAPLLFADDDVDEVVGIDLRSPRVADPKLLYEREDVRSPRMRDLFAGCETVVHLAFVVAEIHDKKLTHSINLGGTKNVITAAATAGVSRVVLASSVASYGAHSDYELPIDEDEFPRGNPDKYYFYDKAEVEHFAEWWLGRHPDAGVTITRVRPPVILGPRFENAFLDQITARASLAVRGSVSSAQFLWEDDLARAFWMAAKRDVPGPLNLGTDDRISFHDFAAIHGQRVLAVPERLAAATANALFRLRLSPVSEDWVLSGEAVVTNERAATQLGWSPRFSSAEAARMFLIQRGRPVLPGRSERAFGRKEVAEKVLEPITARLATWSQTVPGLRVALDGPEEIERAAARVEHELVPHGDKLVHLELHPAAEHGPAIVFSPGIGGFARFYLPVLAKLCDAGFNVIGIDRPGHGLSEGRRGDCTIEQILDVVESAARYARGRFGGPVALMGSSLGGIISWYALTREPDVEAIVCHNIAHPRILHEPAARLKIPPLRRLAKVAPFAPVPIKQIANFEAVSGAPEILDYFRRKLDPIWCWSLTSRSVASLFEYEPPLDWSTATTPTLVLVGAEDEMVTAAFTEQVMAASSPPGAELRLLEGAGHMVFFDELDRSLPVVVDWLRRTLGATRSG
jgi:UDP-glucose 4-epimerase